MEYLPNFSNYRLGLKPQIDDDTKDCSISIKVLANIKDSNLFINCNTSYQHSVDILDASDETYDVGNQLSAIDFIKSFSCIQDRSISIEKLPTIQPVAMSVLISI